MIWALEQLSKFIDIVWGWVERFFNWRPCPKQRTYEGDVPLFDMSAPFGTRDFGIISGNYEGKNFFEYRRALLEMQESLYGKRPLRKNEKELLYICRRVETWNDCGKIVDAFFENKTMKECRLLFCQYEYNYLERDEFVNILTFMLTHPNSFTERQKIFFATIDYNFKEKRVYIPEEEGLYTQLKNVQDKWLILILLRRYQAENQEWYNYIRTVDVSTQELMTRARANFLEERRRPQIEESPQVVRTVVNKNDMILEDIVKRLDRIEKVIGLKKVVENNKENGEIILD